MRNQSAFGVGAAGGGDSRGNEGSRGEEPSRDCDHCPGRRPDPPSRRHRRSVRPGIEGLVSEGPGHGVQSEAGDTVSSRPRTSRSSSRASRSTSVSTGPGLGKRSSPRTTASPGRGGSYRNSPNSRRDTQVLDPQSRVAVPSGEDPVGSVRGGAASWVRRDLGEVPGGSRALGVTPRELVTGVRADPSRTSGVLPGVLATTRSSRSGNSVRVVRSYGAVRVGVDGGTRGSPVRFSPDTKRECVRTDLTALPVSDGVVEELGGPGREPPLEVDDYDEGVVVDEVLVEEDTPAEVDGSLPGSREREDPGDGEGTGDSSTDESSEEESARDVRDPRDVLQREVEEDVHYEEPLTSGTPPQLEDTDVRLGTALEDGRVVRDEL